MESFLQTLLTIDPLWVYGAVLAISFIENVFPPSPSDLVVVFAGSLIGLGRVGFLETLLCATIGSTVGFMSMYLIGAWFGERIIAAGKIRFLPAKGVATVEQWFSRYGYWLIVANRFLAGTRAVVSFFAGMSELRLVQTTVLSALSALAWNTILVGGGYALGANWQRLGFYLETYSSVVTSLVVLILVVLGARALVRRRKGRRP